MINVTVIDGDVSFPQNSGKRLRTSSLLVNLADHFKITYIARAETADQSRAVEFYKDNKINPILVAAPLPSKRGAAFYGRLAANLARPLPYSVTTHHFAAMREAAQRHAQAVKPDVWQLEWSGYHYCLDAGQAPIILQAHNIDTLIWQRYCERETHPLRRAFIRNQLEKMRCFERRIFRTMSRIVCVSAEDATFARSHVHDRPYDVVANGVDIDYFSQIGDHATGSSTFLFLGALDWRPNLDAVDVLISQIWPRVRARCPHAQLLIVGRSAPPQLSKRIAQIDSAQLLSDVPDVRPFLRRAAAMVVPLRIAGGSRLKVLESLAAGLPVISTSIGIEGLGLEDQTHVTVADTADEMAHAIVSALQRPDHHERLASNGRTFVAEHNTWRMLARQLGDIWNDAHAQPARGARTCQRDYALPESA